MIFEILFELVSELFTSLLDCAKIPKPIRIFIASLIAIPIVALLILALINNHFSVGVTIFLLVLIVFFSLIYILLVRKIIKSKNTKSNKKDALF